jgi:hypothetical protein
MAIAIRGGLGLGFDFGLGLGAWGGAGGRTGERADG